MLDKPSLMKARERWLLSLLCGGRAEGAEAAALTKMTYDGQINF